MKKLLLTLSIGIFCLGAATNAVAQKKISVRPKVVKRVPRTPKISPAKLTSVLNRRMQTPKRNASPSLYANDEVRQICQGIEGLRSEKVCANWVAEMAAKDPNFQVTAIKRALRNPYGLSTGKLLVVSYTYQKKNLQQIFAQALGDQWYITHENLDLNNLR